MSLFKNRKKFTVSERDPVYKVRYLGNVQTSMMRGDGCVDKPTAILWSNFLKTPNAGIDMKLTISASGLKAITKEQGLTEYRAHRISYCIAHPKYPKVFVWVYRHEGKKLKVELRCHAVLCKTEAKAKAMAVQLHDKLASALSEFMREKCRKQSTRLALQRTNSLPLSGSGVSNGLNVRNKFLSTAQNFKPPVDRSASAPKLGCITEDFEPEEVVEEEEEEEDDELDEDYMLVMSAARRRKKSADSDDVTHSGVPVAAPSGGEGTAGVGDGVTESVFDLEVGNDVEALKKDTKVRYQLDHTDSEEDDSSESGFSEQDARESSSGSSAFGSDPQLATGGATCPHTATHHQAAAAAASDPQRPCDQCTSSSEAKVAAGVNNCEVVEEEEVAAGTSAINMSPVPLLADPVSPLDGATVTNGRASAGPASGEYNPRIMNERRL